MNNKQLEAIATIGLDLMLKGQLSQVVGYLAGAAKVLEPYVQSKDGIAKVLALLNSFGISVTLPT